MVVRAYARGMNGSRSGAAPGDARRRFNGSWVVIPDGGIEWRHEKRLGDCLAIAARIGPGWLREWSAFGRRRRWRSVSEPPRQLGNATPHLLDVHPDRMR